MRIMSITSRLAGRASTFGLTLLESGDFIDYYAFLMISPQADRAMIEWAARLMLTRYGEKNPHTADPEKHELVKTAYRTLVDAKRKAEYDKLRQQHAGGGAPASDEEQPTGGETHGERRSRDGRVPISKIKVEHTATLDDSRVQRRLRQAVLSVLYDIIITNPRNPELGRAEIARAVGCRVDDLEFAVWFLREKDLIKTSNSGLYAITSVGVEWVESGGVPHLSEPAGPHIVAGKPTASASGSTARPSAEERKVV